MEDADKSNEKGLTLRQQNAIPHLMAPGTLEERARNAGVSPRTVRRWLQDRRFQSKLQQAGEEVMKLATTQLELVAHQAVAVLHDALYDGDVNVRLRAAQALVKLGQNAHYGERLEQQIATIEDAVMLGQEM